MNAKRMKATLLTAILIISIFAVAIPVSAIELPTEVWVDDNAVSEWYFDLTHFLTIQEGVDTVAVGGTVYVVAGTYSSSTNGEVFPLTVSKSLTLKGAKFGVDPTLPEARTLESEESILDATGATGNAIEITANDVMIDGFTVKNMHGEPTTADPVAKYGITARPQSSDHSTFSTDITIQNNILTDNSRGIQLVDNENSLIRKNRIVKSESLVTGVYGWYHGGSGIVLSYVKSTTVVTENLLSENVAKVSYYAPILVMGATSGGYITRPTITKNLITNNYRETTISYGIMLSGATAIIRDNTITGNEGGGIWSRMGSSSYFQGPETLLIIEDNVITENALEGIYIVNNLPGASITGNTVSNNGGTGVSVGTGEYVIHGNNIFGNGYGVSAGVPTDAPLNWWGTTDPNEIALMVGENVDYSSWLTTRVLMTLHVPAPYSTIQDAIDAADTGDTILVHPGIYLENILIDEALMVKSTGGAEETIIDGDGFRYIVRIYHSDVTFEGFTVTDPTYVGGSDATGILVGAYLAESVSNVKILDNIITQVRSEAGDQSMYGATGINIGKGPLSNIVISGNTITDIKNPDGPKSDHTCGINVWDGADNISISNNDISDIKYNGIILQKASNVKIEKNSITKSEVGIRLEPFVGATLKDIHISENTITESTIADILAWHATGPVYIYANNNYETGEEVESTAILWDVGAVKSEEIIVPEGETSEGTVDAIQDADTEVEYTATGDTTISVSSFEENPEEGFSNDAGKYYDVYVEEPAAIESLTLKFYYTDADLGGRTESTLSMLWHDESSWKPVSHQTLHTVSDVSGYSGYIEVYVATTGTTPQLSQMTGTPFGFEGEFPEVADERCELSVSGEVIVEAAEDVTYVYASMGDTAEITVEMDLAGYHGDIYFTLYKKVDGGLAYVEEIRTVYGVELKGSRTASWVVTQSPGTYVVWINIDLMEKVQLTGLDEALHIGPIEVVIS